jgi:hypothetical protein
VGPYDRNEPPSEFSRLDNVSSPSREGIFSKSRSLLPRSFLLFLLGSQFTLFSILRAIEFARSEHSCFRSWRRGIVQICGLWLLASCAEKIPKIGLLALKRRFCLVPDTYESGMHFLYKHDLPYAGFEVAKISCIRGNDDLCQVSRAMQ